MYVLQCMFLRVYVPFVRMSLSYAYILSYITIIHALLVYILCIAVTQGLHVRLTKLF